MAATDIGKVGIVMKGNYNSESSYEVLDGVYYDNSTYIAKQAVPAGTAPTNTTYWQVAVDDGPIQTQIDNINTTLRAIQQSALATSVQSVSKDIENKTNYLFYTVGGSGSYNFVWLVSRSGSVVTSVPITVGSATTVSLTVSGTTITVACSNTTLIMGYVRLN